MTKKKLCTTKRIICKAQPQYKGEIKTIEGYLDESRQLVFLSYVTVEGLRRLGFDIISTVEEGAKKG